jgi:hypothetical protein
VRERAIFPPLELILEASSFVIHFSPSETHLLDQDLSIVFKVEWIDPASLAVRILTDFNKGQVAPPTGKMTEIFSGIYSNEAVTNPMIETLYCVIEDSCGTTEHQPENK